MNKDVTVLYVDDEPINLKIFIINFKKKYNIITASSGDEGLAQLKGHEEIIIVITDMKMPGMDGLEFINKAKQNYNNIAYFILTGFDVTDDIANALEERVINRYFKKPFDMKEVDDAIKKAVAEMTKNN